MTSRVTITGWRVGLNKVGMTKAVRLNAGLSLTDAKAVTDAMLSGESVTIRVPTANAVLLVDQLTALGAIVEVEA